MVCQPWSHYFTNMLLWLLLLPGDELLNDILSKGDSSTESI